MNMQISWAPLQSTTSSRYSCGSFSVFVLCVCPVFQPVFWWCWVSSWAQMTLWLWDFCCMCGWLHWSLLTAALRIKNTDIFFQTFGEEICWTAVSWWISAQHRVHISKTRTSPNRKQCNFRLVGQVYFIPTWDSGTSTVTTVRAPTSFISLSCSDAIVINHLSVLSFVSSASWFWLEQKYWCKGILTP